MSRGRIKEGLTAGNLHFGQKILKMVLFLSAFCEILFIEGKIIIGERKDSEIG